MKLKLSSDLVLCCSMRVLYTSLFQSYNELLRGYGNE
jgi:hypothetical protein